jgi:cysteine desulfurase / selenocysteine lyase
MHNVREKFPLLSTKMNGFPLVYLDTASTSQKPNEVINCLRDYYTYYNSNTGRAPYKLSLEAGDIVESTRHKVKMLINATEASEIIFTKGTTESINIIASCYGLSNVTVGDEIVIAISEHHANLIPWQQVAIQKKATLKYIYFDDNLTLSKKDIENVITSKTKIVCVAHVSNTFGIINPIESIIKKAKSVGAVVVIDSAQSIAHIPIDVTELDIDFLAFSSHKMYGPMGVGILYGKSELLKSMSPYTFGGGMVKYVEEDTTVFSEIPDRFEGGTKNVEAISGFGTAIDFLNNIGYDNLIKHENDLYKYAYDKLNALNYVKVYVNKDLSKHSGTLSFEVIDIHPHDVASILDARGICIRPGKHCTQPLLKHLGINSTCRISFGVYNNYDDIDKLIIGLQSVKEIF